uniref:Site-specific DNA-methyltransferase n=1 Tax=Caenorhabditis tropicalis TaxID=1561998 RepID=A0A1I7UTT7_9PELO
MKHSFRTPPLFPTVSNIRPWLAAERFRYQFFNFNQYGYRPTDDFIEFCGLLGSTTYRVIRNARSDDGVYEMRNVRQMGDTVTFDGDWNEKAWRNPTIRIGGRRYFARSYHETLKIKVARGTVIRPQLVWQDYPAKVGCLKEGFFMDLPDGSNGKIVIKAIYGGPKIPLSHSDLDPPHCYMANLLDSSPITVAEFASGKSRILVETAWKLAKKDPLSQHLLIVQDNSDAINLVHHLQNTGIEAMRYMSEDRWETIGKELTTQLDFPILLKKLLREIVMGTREIEDIVIEKVSLELLAFSSFHNMVASENELE